MFRITQFIIDRAAAFRDCVAIPIMVREPHHERYCQIVKSRTCPFALSSSKGSERITTQSPLRREITFHVAQRVGAVARAVLDEVIRFETRLRRLLLRLSSLGKSCDHRPQ